MFPGNILAKCDHLRKPVIIGGVFWNAFPILRKKNINKMSESFNFLFFESSLRRANVKRKKNLKKYFLNKLKKIEKKKNLSRFKFLKCHETSLPS